MPPKTSSQKSKISATVLVALIGLVGTIITALLTSPVLIELIKKSGATETPAAPVSAPPSNATLVFSEDFEEGDASGFGFNVGEWMIGKDKSNKVLVADTTSFPSGADYLADANFGPAELANGAVEWRLKYQALGGFYLAFREIDGATYAFYARPEQLVFAFNSLTQDWNFSLLGDNASYVSLQKDVWYTFRVEFQEERLSAYLDNNLIFATTDSRLQKGSLHFQLDYGTKVLLDDVKVWSFDR